MADQTNPWDTAQVADTTTQTADAWGTPAGVATDGGSTDWLNSAPAPAPEHFSLLDPFHKTLIPLDSWVTRGNRLGRHPFPSPFSGDSCAGGLHP